MIEFKTKWQVNASWPALRELAWGRRRRTVSFWGFLEGSDQNGVGGYIQGSSRMHCLRNVVGVCSLLISPLAPNWQDNASPLLGATLMLVTWGISPHATFWSIDLAIEALFFEMMVVSEYLRKANLFYHMKSALKWNTKGWKENLESLCVPCGTGDVGCSFRRVEPCLDWNDCCSGHDDTWFFGCCAKSERGILLLPCPCCGQEISLLVLRVLDCRGDRELPLSHMSALEWS